MILAGNALRVAHDLTPEAIISPIHAASNDPALLAAHCLEAVAPALAEQAREGDILVVAGSLRTGVLAETAILALQALGIAALVCCAVDAPLSRLAGDYGLPILVQPAAAATLTAGSRVRLDLERGQISSDAAETAWSCGPCSPDVVARVRRMQLLARMRRFVEDEGFAE